LGCSKFSTLFRDIYPAEGLDGAILWLLTGGTPASLLQLNLAKAAATGVSMGWNFLGYRLLLTR
jgi:hypothetical protein